MRTIPRIIHQIWSGKYEQLPDMFKELGETWKENHPGWEYRVWNEKDILCFLADCFPEYIDMYHSFYYDIQRWDVIRYLILYEIGGMYVDFDYECLGNIEPLLSGKTCAFAMEPEIHAKLFDKKNVFNNALMASIPRHLFMKNVIKYVFSQKIDEHNIYSDKMRYVLSTTGPWMLGNIYDLFEDKESIHLIPAKYVSPLSKMEVSSIIHGNKSEYLEEKLQEAYAIHYFFGTWG